MQRFAIGGQQVPRIGLFAREEPSGFLEAGAVAAAFEAYLLETSPVVAWRLAPAAAFEEVLLHIALWSPAATWRPARLRRFRDGAAAIRADEV